MAAIPKTPLPYRFVVDRVRTVTLGGVKQNVASYKLVLDINSQSLADVRTLIANTTIEAANDQTALGNPPSLVEVDGKTNKDVDAVDRRTEMLFGVTLPQAAMREIEVALRSAIDRATRPDTGRLHDIAGHWQWRFLPAGGGAPRVVSSTGDLVFNRGDRLVLVPIGVPHATIANRNVARSGRLNPRARVVKGRVREVARRLQNAGFLFHAAEAVRKRTAFKFFHVKVVFTRVHMVPGEVMTRKQGTGMIQLSARVRRVG